ncbi:MAG: hypothetical protein P8X70_01180 [Nanoarchaeota archaeon]
MGEKPLSRELYLNVREVLKNCKKDSKMEKMMKKVNKKLEANENYPYLRTNASDCY